MALHGSPCTLISPFSSRVDPARAETMWCAYAWPVNCHSGKRVFHVDWRGDVTAARDPEGKYIGRDLRPAVGAAQVGNDDVPKQAANAQGNDGFTWVVVN
jgi:hypothetical protein